MTEEEAIQKIAVYKERHAGFEKKFPTSDYSRSSRHTFIVNREEWWQEHKVKSPV